MESSEQAFCLFAVVIGLGSCLVWALYEVEEWRRRRSRRADLLRDATRFVLPRAGLRG